MSDLFGEASPSDLEERRDTLKSALTFGDVASALGIAGSTRHGWDCVACGARGTMRENSLNKGARCQACDEGADIISIVRAIEVCSYPKALDWLEAILANRDDPQGARLL